MTDYAMKILLVWKYIFLFQQFIFCSETLISQYLFKFAVNVYDDISLKNTHTR